MSILITGGAGYIGSHIVDLLCESNLRVIVLDNLSSGFQQNLNPKAIFVLGDITKKDDLEDVFCKYQVKSIIHMAGFKAVEESMNNTSKYTENNIIGSLNLISMAIKFKVKEFIFSSTAAIYGIPQDKLIAETCPLNPINHYGYTKLYIENYLKWISVIEDIRFVSLRYFNAAGYSTKNGLIKAKEKKPKNLLPVIMEVANQSRNKLKIFGNNYNTKDGTGIRDYIHVVDLAHAHIKALHYLEKNKSTAFNLSTGIGYSVLEIVKRVEKITNQKIIYEFAPEREGDPAILVSTFDKAKRFLGWTPKYSIDDILGSMWNIYKKI